jgi:hypothetical protein
MFINGLREGFARSSPVFNLKHPIKDSFAWQINILSIKVATSSQFWELNWTKLSKCNPNPNPKPNTWIFESIKYFQVDGKLCFYCFWTLSFEEFWLLFVSVILYLILIFLKKFEKKIWEKSCKNGFLVLSKQSRTKLKDSHKNQSQTNTKCFLKFGTKPNPNPTQTEPNPKEQSQLYFQSSQSINESIVEYIFSKRIQTVRQSKHRFVHQFLPRLRLCLHSYSWKLLILFKMFQILIFKNNIWNPSMALICIINELSQIYLGVVQQFVTAVKHLQILWERC